MVHYTQVPEPARASMGGRCPRCGQGELFEGFLAVRPTCSVCELDLSFADSGDGPAFFVMSITGLVAVIVAFVVRFAFDAPAGVALLVSFAVSLAVTFASLRPMKGLLIGLQYKNDASEGRLS
ncbi:MAG: DUF983 domain-containing protein [Pseudomonadota bacterium]